MLVGPLVVPLVCPHNEILQNLFTWKTGYVGIALRRGEGRGNQLMSKTGYVEIALHLVTFARSCFFITRFSIINCQLTKLDILTFYRRTVAVLTLKAKRA
jgi:hypothetical protein